MRTDESRTAESAAAGHCALQSSPASRERRRGERKGEGRGERGEERGEEREEREEREGREGRGERGERMGGVETYLVLEVWVKRK